VGLDGNQPLGKRGALSVARELRYVPPKMFYRLLIRPVLYAFSAEAAHHFTMGLLTLLSSMPWLCVLLQRFFAVRDPRLEVKCLGLVFPSPIGLAAGLDKDAQAVPALGALGFGFVEVGTITAQPQPGNPQPRLFRLPQDRALINRMGFNNRGAEAAEQRLSQLQRGAAPLGINIGKTKVVANEDAAEDYAASAARLGPHADYLVINVSSPNTPGLRDLQAIESLRPLIVRVRAELDKAQPARHVPLLLKIAPDLSDQDIDAVADLALELRLDGLVATNTTITRSGLSTDKARVEACGAGGLSGAPLKARALAVLARLHARVGERVVLVAAGGIETADDAWERLKAGASLVQVYTALIYDGPGLPSRLARQLSARLRSEGIAHVSALRR
jgi:dihydroorotate dehydrogenase